MLYKVRRDLHWGEGGGGVKNTSLQGLIFGRGRSAPSVYTLRGSKTQIFKFTNA